MEIGNIIVGIIILLICTTPFALISTNKRNREKKLRSLLNEIASKANCTINDSEIWNHSVIGIDITKSMAFYVRNTENHKASQQINLAEVQKCRVLNSNKTLSNSQGVYNIVEKLELAFTTKGKTEISIEIYNAAYDSPTLTGELQLAEKWCQNFNNAIAGFSAQKK